MLKDELFDIEDLCSKDENCDAKAGGKVSGTLIIDVDVKEVLHILAIVKSWYSNHNIFLSLLR